MVATRRQRPIPLLAGSMVVAVLLVGALASWDNARENATALEDFGEERAVIATTAAGQMSATLAAVRRDLLLMAEDLSAGRPAPSGLAGRFLRVDLRPVDAPPPADAGDDAFVLSLPLSDGRRIDAVVAAADLFEGLRNVEQRGITFLIDSPGRRDFRSTNGRHLDDAELAAALERGQDTVRVPRARAARLGLPERTAMAGLARFDAGPLGRWGILALASAERERDRERRASWRLVLAIALASGLVGVFGGLAVLNQRKELGLERELAQARLGREREERIEKLDKAATMITLASGVAHEVSTPLGVIVGRAEQLMASHGDDPRAERSLRAILEQAGRVNAVVRGFLGLARGGSPILERISAQAIVDAATALVEHRFAQAGVALGKQVSPSLPMLRCDPRLLEHALVNLLLNACDACARGGRVAVVVEPDTAGVRFVVTDNGTGIDPVHAARVLEPFFSTKAPGEGTGLGLAIANEIAKSHRGTLSIAPARPRGTRACLVLPVVEEGGHAP